MILVTGLQVEWQYVLYTDHCGETAVRRFRPYNLYWGSDEHHPEPQWLMQGMDEDKKESRTFALKDMRPAPKQVRVIFRDSTYMDVDREHAWSYEGQMDWDRTEEIPS